VRLVRETAEICLSTEGLIQDCSVTVMGTAHMLVNGSIKQAWVCALFIFEHWNYICTTTSPFDFYRVQGGREDVGERHILSFWRILGHHSGAVYCDGGQKHKRH